MILKFRFLGKFFGSQGAEAVLAIGDAERPTVVEGAVNGCNVINDIHRSSCAGENRV